MAWLSRRAHSAPSALLPAIVRLLPAVAVAGAWLALGRPVLAHGDAAPEPTFPGVLTAWSFDPTLQLPILAAAVLYFAAFRHVNRIHAANPVSASRLASWLVGLVAVEIALQSPIDTYEGSLFSVHMVQHMILIFAAAPFLVAAAPITLVLRAANQQQRKRIVLPILHSRLMRTFSNPVVAWIVFTAVLWGTHFSPLFDLALENDYVHDGEHLLYLVSAMLFWWPIVGTDPMPWRLPYPARVVYVFLQMPQNSFLGLALFRATTILYPHYATLDRTWGPTPMADQQLAGGIMWVGGDLLFLFAVIATTLAWAMYEERQSKIDDAREDRLIALARQREAPES